MFSVVCIEIAAAQEYGSHPTERRRYAQHALHVSWSPRGAAGAAAREAVKAATNLPSGKHTKSY